MRNITLIGFVLMGACVPTLARAQQPAPAPKQQPAPKAQPAPKERPTPMAELDEMLLDAHEMVATIDFDAMAFQAKEMMSSIDVDAMARHATDMLSNFDVEDMAHRATSMLSGLDMGHFQREAEGSGRLLETRPRAPWLRGDPADSLYRLAREALNRGEYRRAAQLFNEVTRKFASSGYAQPSAYWEAFARYRLGTTEELRRALRILEGKGEFRFEFAASSSESGVDAPSLRARIQGALAARGDREAGAQLQKEATQNRGCDREEVSVRAEALGALGRMDLNAAMPTVRNVLANRDECTVELRRRALYLLGRDPQEGRVALMLEVAKNDPDAGIRGEAMSWIARVADDQAVPLLEELLRTSTDERAQRSAISALGSVDSERARRAVRTIIERADAPERVRYDAILSLARTRFKRTPSADDVNYLRGLYAKLESQRLREAILTAVSRVPTTENQQFLMAILRNQNEPASLRATALQRLISMQTFTLDDLARLYDVADARSLREQILYGLARRKEPQAIDKLMEIAKKDTDPQIRRTAISLLARSNNERAKQLLQELIDK